MSNYSSSARELLDAAYDHLGLADGDLLAASNLSDLTAEQWLEHADWLELATRVGAEKVFFVGDEPVVVFSEVSTINPDLIRDAFNRTWCMARPSLLFLASPGELVVCDLSNAPVRSNEEWAARPPVLDRAKTVEEVISNLASYRRDQIESGKLFEDARFGHPSQRADAALIQDLKALRRDLIANGLGEGYLRYAHALIGRSIFIRYLEDRAILDYAYYSRIAARNPQWSELLDRVVVDPRQIESHRSIYPHILENYDFVYALFDQLAVDFNGDMFPSNADERRVVAAPHLQRLQAFLLGTAEEQLNLFFWAYKFDIIPIELISSIYEEFYHSQLQGEDPQGTHYTPSTLVDFVLSRVLTSASLNCANLRVLDPACGSGIFLVEAFRRIVRHRTWERRLSRLPVDDLRSILRTQVSGIEINSEAIRIAAFSLYLAFLHYQEPRAILFQIDQGQRLPHLIYTPDRNPGEDYFNILLEANAFFEESDVPVEVLELFGNGCADVVVGNPPWGSPSRKDKPGMAALSQALEWCLKRGRPIGNFERSQAFIWRAFDLLRPGGVAGMLVSIGVFLKRHPRSQKFRRLWLNEVDLDEVVNFSHVRSVFFSGSGRGAKAIAPFATIVFRKGRSQKNLVQYWSAKRSPRVDASQAVVLHRYDLQVADQDDFVADDRLWKVFSWGTYQDYALIRALEAYPSLKHAFQSKQLTTGRGYFDGNRENSASWSKHLPSLPTERLVPFGRLDLSKLEKAPRKVERTGNKRLYHGERVLVKGGITQTGGDARIVSRKVKGPFAFLQTVYGIKIRGGDPLLYDILEAIFRSSLARYYYFLTSSRWGIWHDQLLVEEIRQMPVPLDAENGIQQRVVTKLRALRRWDETHAPLKSFVKASKRVDTRELLKLEAELDEAVFDLYRLNPGERDLVRDICNVEMPYHYLHAKSAAVAPILLAPSQQLGFADSLFSLLPDEQPLEVDEYIEVFVDYWNRALGQSGKLVTGPVRAPRNSPMLGISFYLSTGGEDPHWMNGPVEDLEAFINAFAVDALVPFRTERIYVDGMMRFIGQHSLLVVKRNESRLWTRSRARQDAEATLVQVMNLQGRM
jgi:hypothetical protein